MVCFHQIRGNFLKPGAILMNKIIRFIAWHWYLYRAASSPIFLTPSPEGNIIYPEKRQADLTFYLLRGLLDIK